jgi:hypothetical protein
LVSPDESLSARGSFEAVTADPGQGLTEFAVRQEGARACGPRPPARVVSYVLAQSPTEPDTAPETETTPTEPTPTEPTPTDPTDPEDPPVQQELENELPPETLPPEWELETDEGEPQLLIPRADCEQSFSWVEQGCSGAGAGQSDKAVVAGKQLVRVLSATRTRPLDAPGKTEPVGVALNFNLTLENLKGRTVTVRWSMYRLGAGAPLPHDWLVNRRIFMERLERSSQTVSRQFWVPLPRRQGQYFVRLSAWDADKRLDFEDTKPPFR